MDKNTKLSKVNHTKSEIIVHCLDYMENNDNKKKDEAIKKLSEFAKFYRVSLRKKVIPANIKLHLRLFILNKQGYNETINRLMNSLLNG